ncbi:MAG TPA: acylneuraminate cytidylyltransferase family protein [Candidatus Limnocylindrales bacterium]|nr:acylneuraminate cytidylyltransferase family protein [Candidatus Limnocylindrales bacterium]
MSREPVVAFVFARGGSKGLPGKNVRPLAGTPLIGHAIRVALATPGVSRCIVSTDDPGIAAVARELGAETPFMRPAELATDTAAEWLAWRHAITTLAAQGTPVGTFLSVPATAPLRATADVAACLAAFEEGDADVVITVTEAHRNPYFNMVRLDEGGRASIVIRPPVPITNRQAAPPVYDMTTVAYVADPAFVLRADGLFAGRVRAVVVPPERAIDIDTDLDFRVAEQLMADRGRDAATAAEGAG